MRTFFSLLFCLLFFQWHAQDSLYTRKVLRTLTSEKCYGRGYLFNGLQNAEKFIVKEIRSMGASPLFGKSYTQSFVHPVNTFPGACKVIINNKTLKPGVDFIVDCHDPGGKASCALLPNEKGEYVNTVKEQQKVQVVFRKKLTWSVGGSQSDAIRIELDSSRFSEVPTNITYEIKNKFIPAFESKNIGCVINGRNNDSLVVFSAHYDHLGGMGNATYFPGANDNASGVSVVLNLIRYYREHLPKYKMVFLFFAGEEAGLLGSKFLVNSKVLSLPKIKFLINLDLLGTGDEGIMVVNGSLFQEAFGTLNKINQELHLVPEIKKRGKAANSDHYWFTEAGVPCFFIYTMGGIKAYHDVFDKEETLPLTRYKEVFLLLTRFSDQL